MPCQIHNPTPEAITLPAPLRGVLARGQSYVVSATVAQIAALLGPSPLELATPAMAVSPGEADDWVLGFAAGITETQIADGAVVPWKLSLPQGLPADNTGELGNTVVLRRTIAAGAGGAADDVTLTDHLAVGIEIVDVILHVATAGAGGSTATVRSAAAGAGDALSSALSTAATGVVRSVLTAAATAADGAALYLRRSDNALAGFIDIVAIRAA
jgi:hypothetical protein